MWVFSKGVIGLQTDNVSKLSELDSLCGGDLNLLFLDTDTEMTAVFSFLGKQ